MTDQNVDVPVSDLRNAFQNILPGVHDDLSALVRIPSVSAAAFDQAHVTASAERVAELLRDAGMSQVDILTAPRPDGEPGAPAVVARRPAPAGRPTVMLYAHHDVQPPGRDEGWTTAPFEPTERDGRLFGRGAADDKGGIMAHVAALRSLLPRWGEDDGVGIVCFIEGEEEIGSPSFAAFLQTYRDRLAADVIVVADSDNWTPEIPSLTVTLRGLVDAVVTVSTLELPVHSGMYGGAAPDATLALIRLLDRLWNDDGSVAVPGITTGRAAALDYTEDDLRRDAGVLDGVDLLGSGDVLTRIWNAPSVTVVGIDVPDVAHASNTLQASVAAKLSIRVPPGEDPQRVFEAFRDHLQADPPFGARVTVDLKETGHPFSGDVTGPVYEAARWALRTSFGSSEVVEQGIGGSIPFINEFLDTFPDAAVLVTGVEDHDSRAHGLDESIHLAGFERAAFAEVLLLQRLSGLESLPS